MKSWRSYKIDLRLSLSVLFFCSLLSVCYLADFLQKVSKGFARLSRYPTVYYFILMICMRSCMNYLRERYWGTPVTLLISESIFPLHVPFLFHTYHRKILWWLYRTLIDSISCYPQGQSQSKLSWILETERFAKPIMLLPSPVKTKPFRPMSSGRSSIDRVSTDSCK